MSRAIIGVAVLLAAGVLPAQQGDIIIRAATLIDGKGSVLTHATVVIEGSRIKAVGAGGNAPVTYNLGNATLMPGWIDTHVHLGWHFDKNGRLAMRDSDTPPQAALAAAASAYSTLMGGFTTVQSLGEPLDSDLRQAIERDGLAGPRILTSLRQINENSGDPEKIRALVRQLAADGANVVKLFATKSIRDGGEQSMTDAQIQAACGEAKAAGLRAVVHAHASSGARAAILAGCTAIEHGTFLDDATLELMAARGVFFDPNFLVLHNYLENRPKFLGIGNYTEEGFGYMEKAVPLVADALRRATAKKVKIVLGTDAVAGAHGRNAEEFIYRVRDGGQKPMDAIVSATSVAAESLGLGDRLGTIAPGMDADLVATASNPLGDITTVRRVVFVMRGGKVYRDSAVSK